MKIVQVLIILLLLFSYCDTANAAVFMPTVIYSSTLSFGYFMANLLLLTIFYISMKGLVNNLYFGKAGHEILRLLFSFIGRLIVAILMAFIAIKAFDPIDVKEVATVSIFASLLSFIFVSFANFRFYRLMRAEKRAPIINSLLSYFIMVFIATFFSASLAINTEVINTTGDFEKEYIKSEIISRSAGQSSEIKEELLDYEGLDKNSGDEKASLSRSKNRPYDLVKRSIWFFPQNEESCDIYYNGIKVSNIISAKNCFYYKANGEAAKISCPMQLKISDLPLKKKMIGQESMISGQGSCIEKYAVTLKANGFILK